MPAPPDADRQAELYDGLTPLFNRVGPGDLSRYFKSEALGTAGQGPLRTERIPGPGMTHRARRLQRAPHHRAARTTT